MMKNLKTFDQLFESEGYPTVKFQKYTCELDFGKYSNGRIGIDLVDKKTGELVLGATVNIPEEQLGDGEVIIKNYSENEGVLDALISAGVISKPIRTIKSNFIEAPVCKLLVEPPK